MKRVVAVVVAAAVLLGAVRLFNRVFRHNAWQAYVSAVRSDLRNVASAQADHRARTGRFAADLSELADSAFLPAAGVTVRVVVATDSVLRLEGTHDWFAPGAVCVLELGDARPAADVRCDGFVNWLNRPRRAR
jgi:hypothetical protein